MQSTKLKPRPSGRGAKKRNDDNRPGEFRVSQSKIKVWRRCHQAYHYKFVLGLRKKVKSRPLLFGSIVHDLLDVHAEGDDPMEKLAQIAKENKRLFAAQREQYGEIVDDVRVIMSHYFDYYDEKDFRFERHNGRSAEHPFNIELIDFGLGGVFWNGKIDATGKTPNKLKWILEHKSFSRRVGDDERWRNLQSSTYLRAVDILGWGNYDGMCWDYIWSKPPTKPQLLKNGELSEKNIDTLPITVRETIAEEKLNPKNYKGFLIRAEENLAKWFQRIHTPVNKAVVDSVWNDFIFSIRDMVDNHGKCSDKNIDRHCNWCDFEGLCRAELQGLDVDFVMQRDYELVSPDEHEQAIADAAD